MENLQLSNLWNAETNLHVDLNVPKTPQCVVKIDCTNTCLFTLANNELDSHILSVCRSLILYIRRKTFPFLTEVFGL